MKYMYTVNGTWINKKKKIEGLNFTCTLIHTQSITNCILHDRALFGYVGGSDSWQGFRSKLQIKTTYKICWYRSDPREVGAVYQGTQTRFLLLTHNVNYKLSLILRQ